MSLCVWIALSACGGDTGPRPPRAGSGGGGRGGSGEGGDSGEGGAGDSGEGGAGDSGQGGAGDSGEGGAGASGQGGESGEGGTGGERVFDAGDAADRNDVVAGNLCDRLTTIQCAGEAFCCSDPGRSFDDCKAVMLKGCNEELMFDAIAGDARSGFDMAHARSVYVEIERRASECDMGIAAYGESLAGLRGMFKGTVPAGGSCTSLNPLNRQDAAQALSSCADIANNACLPALALWECEPRQGDGGDCFSDVNCMDGLFCDNPSFDIGGSTCGARKMEGASCQLPNECASLFCKGGKCVAPSVDAAYCLAQ